MTDTIHLAPCGMNCSLCVAFQREKNRCAGCNSSDKNKVKHIAACRIKHCKERESKKIPYCYSCKKFPCKLLEQLDKRYRTKYGMSMIENLQTMEKEGINKFKKMEKVKWACNACGELLCVHRDECQTCGNKKKVKTKY